MKRSRESDWATSWRSGIAKREELLFTRDRQEPIVLAENDPALLLIERIRDEAHRFAVTFHRKARSMRDLRSQLDDVPGIGPRRRRALLTKFGSLAGVRRATREELEMVVGPKAATARHRLLREIGMISIAGAASGDTGRQRRDRETLPAAAG
jgi:excinuclease ABC subunit C